MHTDLLYVVTELKQLGGPRLLFPFRRRPFGLNLGDMDNTHTSWRVRNYQSIDTKECLFQCS